MPWRGARLAIPADRIDSAVTPIASAASVRSGGSIFHATSLARIQLPTTTAIATGTSATSLPAMIDHRGIGRDHRYVVVRSSMSSPIEAATNIGASTDAVSTSNTNTSV